MDDIGKGFLLPFEFLFESEISAKLICNQLF